MSDLRKSAQMALKFCEALGENYWGDRKEVVYTLRAALAQPEPVMINGLTEVETNASASVMGLTRPEPEPVAWLSIDSIGERYLCFSKPLDSDPAQPLYAHPPKRKPLSDELIDVLARAMVKGDKSVNWLCRVIEAEHGIGVK